jgi:hypothetical protein
MAKLDDYVITTVERERGKWQAEIRRKDGGEMRLQGTTMLVFTTMFATSPGESMKLAQQAIDTNRISPAGLRVEVAVRSVWSVAGSDVSRTMFEMSVSA